MKNSVSAERLRKLLTEKRIKHKDFADLCNVVPQTISRIINGKTEMTPIMAEKCAQILNVSPEYLLGETDDPQTISLTSSDFLKEVTSNRAFNFLKMYVSSDGIYFDKQITLHWKNSRNNPVAIYSWDPGHELYKLSAGVPYQDHMQLEDFEMYKLIADNPDVEVCYEIELEYKNQTKTIDVKDFYLMMANLKTFTKNYLLNSAGIFDTETIPLPNDMIYELLEQRKANKDNG